MVTLPILILMKPPGSGKHSLAAIFLLQKRRLGLAPNALSAGPLLVLEGFENEGV
jgi:hypothetical protein